MSATQQAAAPNDASVEISRFETAKAKEANVQRDLERKLAWLEENRGKLIAKGQKPDDEMAAIGPAIRESQARVEAAQKTANDALDSLIERQTAVLTDAKNALHVEYLEMLTQVELGISTLEKVVAPDGFFQRVEKLRAVATKTFSAIEGLNARLPKRAQVSRVEVPAYKNRDDLVATIQKWTTEMRRWFGVTKRS